MLYALFDAAAHFLGVGLLTGWYALKPQETIAII